MGILKPVIWVGVAGTLATGAAFAVMGPHRAHALFDSVHGQVNAAIDSQISDTVALRAQIERMGEDHPERIAELKGVLAEIGSEVDQLERERIRTSRALELARADLAEWQPMLTRAQEARSEGNIVRVRFDRESLTVEDAFAKATRVGQFIQSNQDKIADIDFHLSALQQQQAQFADLLAQSEVDYANYQSQLHQLDRKVDTLARNERMLELVEKRNQAFADWDRYAGYTSSDVINSQLDKMLAEQQAQFNDLAIEAQSNKYQLQADAELAHETLSYEHRMTVEIREGDFPFVEIGTQFDRDVVEITPESCEAPKAPSGPIASNN